ncbi:MAG TPA: acetyl-CoA carboxylase biotin carboxyl carrier protein [Candidatus Polarisedimenticolaceae bacterium]
MEARELRDLIELISRSNFSTFELEREGFKLRLVKGGGAVPGAPAPEVVAPASSSASPLPAVPPAVAAAPILVESGLVDVASPIVGTYYRQPSPGSDPFVEVGSRVKKGQVLCIIEAMKLMNEIEAEIDGEVVEICVQNAQPVEFGEVLFRIRPA